VFPDFHTIFGIAALILSSVIFISDVRLLSVSRSSAGVPLGIGTLNVVEDSIFPDEFGSQGFDLPIPI
jgi:hypothetical protein